MARTLEDLAAFAAYAIPLIDLLDSLPKSANWGEWLDQLGALATRALKYPDRVLSVLAELAPMGPVGPVALNEVLLVLEPLLLQVAVPPASQRYGKVFVAPVDATRGMSFDAVFVPGLAEKMFPRKYSAWATPVRAGRAASCTTTGCAPLRGTRVHSGPFGTLPALARDLATSCSWSSTARPTAPDAAPVQERDTGMGLERMASAIQGVDSNYRTDLFAPIIDRLAEFIGHDPETVESERFSYQVVADHSRAR